MSVDILALPWRTLASVRRHGVSSAARRGWLALAWHYREWRLGIQTRGSIDASQLGVGTECFGYQPIAYHSFDVALRQIPLVEDVDVFVDYGCGLGRAVILAALLPFRRVIGVEVSPELCARARENVRRVGGKLRCRNVEIVNSDAADYALPDDASVLFLFNPFSETVVASVLDQTQRSLARRPRRLSIVYALPNCRRDLIAEQDWLDRGRELETVHSDWQRLVVYTADGRGEGMQDARYRMQDGER